MGMPRFASVSGESSDLDTVSLTLHGSFNKKRKRCLIFVCLFVYKGLLGRETLFR